jgi:Uma2 family endonuclease
MSTIDRTETLSPLVAGQRMRQPEFHARYEAMPRGTWAELIGGIVVMPGPVGSRHGSVSPLSTMWVGLYRFRTPGLEALRKATVILDDLAEPHPDVALRIAPSHGGQSYHVGNYVGGAPELIVEVASTSRATDLGPKLLDYERSGVLEYVVFALDPDEVFWHVRRGDRFVRVPPDGDGIYRSQCFHGLWLDPQALFADDGLRLMAILDQGLATPEHAAFVAELAARAARPRP